MVLTFKKEVRALFDIENNRGHFLWIGKERVLRILRLKPKG